MKPQATDVWLHTPRNLDPYAIPGLKGLEVEAVWLVHKILSLAAAYKHAGKQFVSISRQTMEQFVHPKHVSRLRRELLDARVILCNGDFRRGSHSLGYRIGDRYRTELHRVEVSKRSLAAKIQRDRLRLGTHTATDERRPIEEYLLGWLKKVRIDSPKAYRLIDNIPHPANRKPRELRAYRAMNRMTVDEIAHGEFTFKVCRYGRCHTNVTRLVTPCRSCLYFDGFDSPLACIDIRNSQLIFLCLLLQQHHLQHEYPSSNTPPSSSHRTTFCAGVACGLSDGARTVSRGDRPADDCRFIQFTLAGLIYDHLMGLHNVDRPPDEQITDRKKFKHVLFRDLLFSDPRARYVKEARLTSIFREQFPSVFNFIQHQKEQDWRNLAREMQRQESSYMIGGVVRRLMDHHPEIPILTIHDSVLCPRQHLEVVERIMLEEFARLGVRPTLKVESGEVCRETTKAA